MQVKSTESHAPVMSEKELSAKFANDFNDRFWDKAMVSEESKRFMHPINAAHTVSKSEVSEWVSNWIGTHSKPRHIDESEMFIDAQFKFAKSQFNGLS